MPVVTISLRSLVAFSLGLAVAIIAMFAFRAWRVDAAPGDLDRTFVPIQPCRLMDTRPAPSRIGANGTFGPDETRVLNIRGTQGLCTIPADALGLSLNVTSVDATQLTFLTIWPGGERPLTSNLNPSPGAPPTPNAVTTDVSDTGTLNIYNNVGNVNVIIDVNGYYTTSSLTSLSAEIAAANSRIATTESRITQLETGQPIALTAATTGEFLIPNEPDPLQQNILTLSVPTPVRGNVTVIAQVRLREDDEASTTRCAIRHPFLPIVASENDQQIWQLETVPTAPIVGELTLLHTETNTKNSAPPSPSDTIPVRLKCETLDGATVTVEHAEMTAIFTPA